MTHSPFKRVTLAPRDPILGLSDAFNTDARPTKINLGVGVYFDDGGRLPLLAAVREAENLRAAKLLARSYLPIDGIHAYNDGVKKLLFGVESPLITDGRIVTIQALGGTGALRIGADFLKRLSPSVEVWISDPSWENHRALFEAAGFVVRNYPYYDPATHGLKFDAMIAALATAAPGAIVVLHACCHNPTGVDLDADQWRRVIDVVRERDLVPYIDIAYQGFGDGLEADAFAVRAMADAGIEFLVASSFSKSFSLYGERVGALSIVTASRDEAARVLSQLKRTIRTNYSNPPTHGGAIIVSVLGTPTLRAMWEEELGVMRERIRAMRIGLVERLTQRIPGTDFGFVARQRGMFSYSGLNAAQVERLKDEFGIYALSSGRICVAALNPRNIDAVADAIAAVCAPPR